MAVDQGNVPQGGAWPQGEQGPWPGARAAGGRKGGPDTRKRVRQTEGHKCIVKGCNRCFAKAQGLAHHLTKTHLGHVLDQEMVQKLTGSNKMA